MDDVGAGRGATVWIAFLNEMIVTRPSSSLMLGSMILNSGVKGDVDLELRGLVVVWYMEKGE